MFLALNFTITLIYKTAQYRLYMDRLIQRWIRGTGAHFITSFKNNMAKKYNRITLHKIFKLKTNNKIK